MLSIHVYIKGKSGTIERSYNFLQPNGKDTFEPIDLIIPYDEENKYPITENDAKMIMATQLRRGEH
jgi:hypothetical protein